MQYERRKINIRKKCKCLDLKFAALVVYFAFFCYFLFGGKVLSVMAINCFTFVFIFGKVYVCFHLSFVLRNQKSKNNLLPKHKMLHSGFNSFSHTFLSISYVKAAFMEFFVFILPIFSYIFYARYFL